MEKLGAFLLVRFRTDRQQNLTDLRDAPSFTIRDVLKAAFQITRNSKRKRSIFFHDLVIV